MHHGTISASSEGLGKGATFSIEVPLFEVASALCPLQDGFDDSVYDSAPPSVREGKVDKSNDTPPLASVSSSFSELNPALDRILVVDDSSLNRKMAVKLLRRIGYDCVEAENGQMAIDVMQSKSNSDESPISVILMDSEMPVMKGPEATKRLRELGFKDAIIIGVTGNVLPEDISNFLRHGADAVLSKPLSLDALKSAISQVHSRR